MTLQRLVPAIMAMLAMTIPGCGKKAGQEPRQTSQAQAVTGVTLAAVKTVQMPAAIEVSGIIHSRTSALVSARIPGTISVLRAREGDRVHKGQLLAQLEARENQANAAMAAMAADESKKGLDEALARKRLADATFERYHKLFNEQAISRQEFDVKRAEHEIAAQSAARAEARLKQALEGARAAETMADYTRIIAPITGVITNRQVDLGATVFPAQPLMTIEDERSYQLDLAVPESFGTKVRPGTPVQVTLDAFNETFAATIIEVVPAADPASRTFTAKVNLSRHGLKSGLFGRGSINLGTGGTAIMIPRQAIVERGALTSVWVVGTDKIARMRLIRTGKAAGDQVEVLSGLVDGERVVVSGLERVSEGALIP